MRKQRLCSPLSVMSLDTEPPKEPQHWPQLLVVGTFLPEFGLGGMLAGIWPWKSRNLRRKHHHYFKLNVSSPSAWLTCCRTAYLRRRITVAHVTVFSGLAFIYAECITALLAALGKAMHFRSPRRQPSRFRRSAP